MIKDLLEELINEVQKKAPLEEKYLKSNGNANGFEDLFKDKIIDEFNVKVKSLYPSHSIILKGNFGHTFPDLDLKVDNALYGIELKSRKDGTWQTQGGSVFETTSRTSYKEIYIIFATFNAAKKERAYQLKYAPYWQVADAIKVTHSPRFHINFNNPQSIFKSNDDYKAFRNLNKEKQNKKVQSILKETTSKSVWYINPVDTLEPTSYTDLKLKDRKKIFIESLVLFPLDFLKQPKGNYENVTKYFLSQYYIISSAMRDRFTAGGKISVGTASFPRIIQHYIDYSDELSALCISSNKEFLDQAYTFWKWPTKNEKHTFLEDFKLILDQIGDQYYTAQLAKTKYTSLSQLIFNQDTE